MTNRKWMLEQDEYDLLMLVNDFMAYFVPACALEPLATEAWWLENGRSKCNHDCKACVQKWLNEERK